MNLTLRTAKISNLSTVLSWIPDAEACLIWAGPKVRYPATAESAWEDIEASEGNAFSLVTDSGDIVGFGQVLPRDSCVAHLARIIVAPGARRRGYGRSLCLQLMEVAEKRLPVRQFTLNAYKSNRAAISLYRSLGFAEQIRQDLQGVLSMSMLANNSATRTDCTEC